jgi:hypothetical protein
MWKILFKSRIVEDVQLKVGSSFKARGEEEPRKNLRKLAWNCYFPIKNYEDFKMAPTRAKSHKSNLFHEKMIREILLQEVNDLPIWKDYNQYKNK